MAEVAQNLSYASPVADAQYAQVLGNPQLDSYLAKLSEISAWQIILTVLAILVAYDQCKNISISATKLKAHC
jgi:C-22 sterol desaturase